MAAATTTTTAPVPAPSTSQGLVGALAFLGLLPAGGPVVPAANPAPWTLLWWTQRARSLLNNQSPTAAPTLTPTGDGYTISLGATDPDGDPLTTTITTQPTNGVITPNADGTFTYTPNAGSTAADQFTVTISDSGPHIHGLASILALFTGQNPHTRTVTIHIPETSTPPANQPPVVDPDQEPTVGTPDAVTGSVVVTGLASMVTDPDNDPLIFYTTDTDVVFDDQNPGTFTWTPTTELRHDAAVPGAPHTHTIVITADDGNGGTVDLTVVVPIGPQNTTPTLAISPPSTPTPGSATVTGTITTGDNDSDDLTFTVAGATPTGTNTFITAGGATLVIDPTTGTYTYTPSGAQQLAASYVNATTADLSEIVTLTVDDGHGGTVTESIDAPVSGIILPGGGYLDTQFGPDGTVHQGTATVDPTTGALDTVYITSISPTGTTTIALLGMPFSVINVGPDGTAHQGTFTSDPTTHSPNGFYITSISTTGTTTTTILPGFPSGGMQFSPDGTVHQTTMAIDPNTDETYVTSINPTGTITTALPGSPLGSVQIGPDGTAHQTTMGIDPNTGDYGYRITSISPTGTATTTTLPDYPLGTMQIGPDGTVYQTTGPYDTNTTITSISTTGTTTTTTLPGSPVGGVQIGPDGTIYQTTYGDYSYYITSISTTGTVTTTLPGFLYSVMEIGPDGTVHQVTYTSDPMTGVDTFHITSISTTGTVTTTTLPGYPYSNATQFGPDGTSYQITRSLDPNTDETYVITISPTGTTTTTPLPGAPWGDMLIGPDGAVYQTIHTSDPNTGFTTYHIASISTTGPITTTPLLGEPAGDMQLGPDGTVYRATYTYDFSTGDGTTHITSLSATGTTTTTTVPDRPVGGVQIAADGTVLQFVTDGDVTRLVVIKRADTTALV
ncbi:hypothetical protein GII31_14480 [Gordonia pseudamarae]|uniref:Cadherin domain-containing protein n=2 Tax=Gordonia pseudamarae TaxID=2831662 RepID=A0ABX6IJL0_9ACTN|nr:hypothetical protein GII31_14480 [Gordonia pseudamarae]